MGWDAEISALIRARRLVEALDLDGNGLEIGAYLLNQLPISRASIPVICSHSEHWVGAAIARTDLRMRRDPRFRAEVEALERRLRAALRQV